MVRPVLGRLHDRRNAKADVAVAVDGPDRRCNDDAAQQRPRGWVGDLALHQRAELVRGRGEHQPGQTEHDARGDDGDHALEGDRRHCGDDIVRVMHTPGSVAIGHVPASTMVRAAHIAIRRFSPVCTPAMRCRRGGLFAIVCCA